MIEFDNISKSYPGGIDAVLNLNFKVDEGETLVLLGTSGCGKTTSLKMINRLIEPTSGRVLINGQDNRKQDPIELRRSVGYAIQHIGLFPHMTVAGNIAVMLGLLKWPREKIDARVDELLNMVGLNPTDFKDRYPIELSGGQKQRIGVARALAADPPIILMDEPFGALDPITREQLQNELLDLLSEIKKTIIFVTHDIFEAIRMGDRIALLDQGRLQQLATPAELVKNPANEIVDSFLGNHRFQLSLMTTRIKTIMPRGQSSIPDQAAKSNKQRLLARHTLIEALDMFKTTARDNLPVFERGEYIGNLEKKSLLVYITRVLEESGE